MASQITDTVLMVRPIAFGYNAQTAKNNYFQVNSENQSTQEKALEEFNFFVKKLQDKGINTIVIDDTIEPHTPDSIFPNNWISFSSKGEAILYPMFAPNRRDERRLDIIEKVKELGYSIDEIIDLTAPEEENKFLEGTGSMILDHENRIAYGSVSFRLDEILFREFCQKFNFKPIVFHSFQSLNGERLPIYHTNVMMCVAEQFVVICLDCIDIPKERALVIETIKNSEKEIIEISENQMKNFAGNMLQVKNQQGEKFLVMSQNAYRSLSEEQISQIKKHCDIISADLSTIETNGGGSARCMLAEVFSPKQ